MRHALVTFLLGTLLLPLGLEAQLTPRTDRERQALRLEATPVGALPPLPLPMPASRDHHYWVGRAQAAYRTGRAGPDLLAVGGGLDLQWLGGSIFGLSAGYQQRECADSTDICGGHFMGGIGARLNLLAGGPGPIASAFNDFSGTTTLGLETSFGYAPEVLEGMDACTMDVGVPFSSAMFQNVRIATFVTPGIVWDLGCGAESSGPQSYRLAAGVGILQLLGRRGLDVFFGGHRLFRSGTGYHFGISVVYVHLPSL